MKTILIEVQVVIDENGESTIFKYLARDARTGQFLNLGNSVSELQTWLDNQ